MARSSKDIAARLRFDRFPRPDFFRRRYLLVGLLAAALGLGLWFWMTSTQGALQYSPGPVTQNHATFGARCEDCHDPFQNVRNDACLACHPARTHSQWVVREADCRECHVEHLGDTGLLDVHDQACVVCHGDLQSERAEPEIARDVASFADHPQFAPLREDARDPARLRFNHEIHLTSDNVRTAAPDSEQCEPYRALTCASCHRLDATGMLMQPVTFERDCRCCHAQTVPGPVGSIEAPHEAPQQVRRSLAAQLLVIGVARADEIFSTRETLLPGVRDRGPIDESRSLREYQRTWLERLEAELYRPFDDRAPLLEHNKYCFLCHDAQAPYVPGGELPVVAPTDVPRRWFRFAVFGHRKHEMLRCEDCHATVRQSAPTSDVNLPGKELCERCHGPDPTTSAGVECVLCHLYHDTSKDPALRAGVQKPIPVSVLLGLEPARGGVPHGGASHGVPEDGGESDPGAGDAAATPAAAVSEPGEEPAPAEESAPAE
ncbi:MAG TPA: cytochrome c3 family protein [Candidatus Binatia bacterium]